jgi:hypothetical protein
VQDKCRRQKLYKPAAKNSTSCAPNLTVPYSDRLQLFGRIFYGALGIERTDMEARDR